MMATCSVILGADCMQVEEGPGPIWSSHRGCAYDSCLFEGSSCPCTPVCLSMRLCTRRSATDSRTGLSAN